MQQGFAARKKKAANKRAKRKLKKQHSEAAKAQANAMDADVDMQQQPGGEAAQQQDSDDGIDYTLPKGDAGGAQGGGRASHAAKVHLKRNLRLTVTKLKAQRGKLTKLPGARGSAKAAKKQLSANIKQLIEQEASLSGGKKGGGKPKGKKQPGQLATTGSAPAAASGGGMDE